MILYEGKVLTVTELLDEQRQVEAERQEALEGTLRLTLDGDDTWQVHQLRRDFPPAKVAQHLPLSYAQGLAEDTARRLGVERLAAAEAPWRRDPASEKQLTLLKKFDIVPKPGLTKGEAADQISAIMGDWT